MDDPQNDKPKIFPILLINFIGNFGYSVVLPFIVMLVLRLGGNELSYGFLGATYSFFQLIGAPILGSWSDRYGRRKILLLSEGGTLAAWVLFLIALYLPANPLHIHSSAAKIFLATIPLLLIFIARAVDGLTGGNVSVANAYLADISIKKDRKKNFGKMTAAANIGLIFGPALAGILGATSLGYVLPVLAAILISAVSLFTIAFGLKEVKPKVVTQPLLTDKTETITSQSKTVSNDIDKPLKMHLSSVLKLPFVAYFLVLYFLIFLGFNFFYVSFPVYVVQQLHWNIFKLGVFFSVLSGLLVVVQGPVLTLLSSKISGSKLVITGSLLLAIGFALFCSKSLVIIYLGLVFFAFGNGIMWPSFLALLSNAVEDRYQGVVQGFASSSGSLASIIGLVSGAFLYKILGANIFLLTTIFMIAIAIASYWLMAIEKKEE